MVGRGPSLGSGVSRQIIRPGDQQDVPPHEHHATEITGTFGFFRALKAVIDGDLTLRGFFRTAKTGRRIEIRPDSGTGLVPSIHLFTATADAGFIEVGEVSLGVEATIIDAPGDTKATLFLRDDGSVHVHINNVLVCAVQSGQILVPDGSAAAPSIAFLSDPEVGFFKTADGIGVAV